MRTTRKSARQCRMDKQARLGAASIILTLIALLCAFGACVMADAQNGLAAGSFFAAGALAFVSSVLCLIIGSEA